MSYTDPDELRERYWGRGESAGDIADSYGVTRNAVLYHMDKHDIPRRHGIGGRPSEHGGVRSGVWAWDAEGNYRRVDAEGGE